MTKYEISYVCSQCGKKYCTSPMYGVPRGMYSSGLRVDGNDVYCEDCAKKWKEQYGQSFDEMHPGAESMFKEWWNRQVDLIKKANPEATVKFTWGGYAFELVKKIPQPPYEVWNIGSHNMRPGYIPFSRLRQKQPFPEARMIEVSSLLAVKHEKADIVMRAASHGGKTVKDLEKLIKKEVNSEWKQIFQEALVALREVT